MHVVASAPPRVPVVTLIDQVKERRHRFQLASVRFTTKPASRSRTDTFLARIPHRCFSLTAEVVDCRVSFWPQRCCHGMV